MREEGDLLPLSFTYLALQCRIFYFQLISFALREERFVSFYHHMTIEKWNYFDSSHKIDKLDYLRL